VNLTPEQIRGVELAAEAFRTGRDFALGGYAGTGKTTLMKSLVEQFPSTAVVAYTGKAVEVLRSKGLPDAQTIHSLIYSYDQASDEFILKKKSEVDVAGFFIDEASMVGGDIYRDLKSFDKPIIAIGDPGQLPPVSPSDLNLVETPDYCLEQIHRQAEGSGILDLAHHIRHGGGYADAPQAGDAATRPKRDLGGRGSSWLHFDVLLCGMNATRHRFNRLARQHRSIQGQLKPGEPLICLQNNKQKGWFNGAMGTVLEVGEVRSITKGEYKNEITQVNFQWADGRVETLPVLTSSLGCRPPDWRVSRNLKCCVMDYGYAITCHKSQGSEWDRVAIIREEAPALWDQKRWDYTAITRAAKEVRIFV
jgi:exodeoxyribonuclease-5